MEKIGILQINYKTRALLPISRLLSKINSDKMFEELVLKDTKETQL